MYESMKCIEKTGHEDKDEKIDDKGQAYTYR
ncbi:hypothetical protein BLA29_011150 [Euroglyphus maynei]|uniref:Uncharacterized protein n=1 Tax=Euroglyphus maynei TaxID=6958 RepID=A0A1Y3BCR8_EURMA|nr:hypothetical protein BLA29_011150 [Euroglyphus maynei]